MALAPMALLFAVSAVLYAAAMYGGIRSPDSEIVFRTAESLASSGTFAVRNQLETWPGFGLAPGSDGQLYSIFGPAESVLAAPLIAVATRVNRSGWYEHAPFTVPVSFYVGTSLNDFLRNQPPQDPQAHATRFLVSFSNVVIGAAGVVMFWRILAVLVACPVSAGAVAVLYAFGTLAWPYAGTWFSEPLATVCVLAAFLLLIGARSAASPARMSVAGVSLGLGCAAHISALLFVPFFAALAAAGDVDRRARLRRALLFLAGLGVPLAALGYYNFARFGSWQETGRGVVFAGAPRYGRFVAPWEGLYGLLIGSAKGLLLYCPATLFGLICWRRLHRLTPAVSLVLAATAAARLLFLAARSDWHGGFCLGPRYLLMLVPFLLIPVAAWLAAALHERRRAPVAVFVAAAFVCISEQLYFCIGEIFSYLQLVKAGLAQHHIDPFARSRIYLDWSVSPLLHLLEGRRGPLALHAVPLSNVALWLIGTAVIALCLPWWYRALSKHGDPS